MVFAALLAAYYYLRGITEPWPPSGVELDVVGMGVGTLLLGIGSLTMAAAQSAAMRYNAYWARFMLALTILVALAFLGIEWQDWRTSNFAISDSGYGTVFFTLTGTHFAHVVAGVVLLTAVSIYLRTPAFTREHRAAVEAVSYYWHFVFVVWVAVYATIFLIK